MTQEYVVRLAAVAGLVVRHGTNIYDSNGNG